MRHSARRLLDTIVQDLRYGFRTLTRTPLATGVMVGSVALGIGVTTAVFTLADAMLLRPLPYPMAERLVVPYQTVTVPSRARQDTVAWTFARYDVLRAAVPGFADAGFAAWVDGIVRTAADDKPVRIEAVTHSLLTTFSIQAQAGRLFVADEDSAGVPTTVAMISDHLWRTVYGAKASILGETIDVNATPVTIVGIMPRGFTGFAIGADVWLPLRMVARIDPSPRWTERLAAQSGTVIARMAPGLTTTTLKKHLDAALPLVNQIASDRFVAPDERRGIGVVTLAEARRHPLVKPILELLGVAVVSLLLIVCANIASILLARGHARRGEIGVRIAIGASHGRVGRQVLTESLLLGVLGLPPGILIGYWCADALASVRPALPQNWVLLRGTDLLAGVSLAPNLRVVAFASIVAGLATLLFGTGPAIAASRVDPVKLMTSSGDSHTAAPVRGRQLLVVSQVALATILLVTAGLMARSLGALLDADLGFTSDGVATLRLTSTDTSAAARLRRQDFFTRVASVPGVTGVAMSSCAPFDLACMVSVGVRALGTADATARPVEVELHSVSAAYLHVMRIPVVAGRGFTAEDTTTGQTQVILSESAARRLFGTVSPIGKRIAFDESNARPMDVVGVSRDVRFKSVETVESPAVYFLAGEDSQAPRFNATLFVRTSGSAAIAASMLARDIRVSGAPMSVAESRTLAAIVRAETSSTRFVATLLLGFAASAVLLAGLGIYGVIAYIVSQRTREFGVRIILGANEGVLLGAMVKQGGRLVGAGVGLGIAVALSATRLINSFLYGVGAFDLATYFVVVVVVTAIGLLATFIPAKRITRIDPAEALRA